MTCGRLDIDRVVRETFVARAEYHPTLTSTNDRATRCATEAPGELPLLVVADEQAAGRGRRANRWWTGRGSLAFSLLLEVRQRDVDRRSGAPLAALAAAVAIVETVAPLLTPQPVGIHWPNDVWAAGRKLAGVLVDVLPDRRHVIGIGLNTNNSAADAPPELRETVATLRDLTHRLHDRTTVLVTLLGHLKGALEQLAVEPEQIADRADHLCLQHGQTLALRLGGRTISGRCAGIAPDGALRLETAQGSRTFRSGVLCP